MRYFLAIAFALLVGVAKAENYGVLSEARVVKLPEDGNKWYVSVIGQPGAKYQEVLAWFDSGKLKELKSKVHFFAVTSDMPIYERYKTSIKALPTVRVQDASGKVIYESAGKNIPMSGEGLYSAIAGAVNGSEELLPWRRNHSNPTPDPVPPDATPPDLDPEPGPIDNGGAPVIEPVDTPIELPVAVVIGALLAGLIWGQVEKMNAYRKAKK
jgi:hypothetical protein